ncbi:MAG TPA: glycosyltransferase family A protein [Solirubrobacteraceae bacterium]|nr:glycosyltransferase family A protein [Solirubrobacteraceae bacterium]
MFLSVLLPTHNRLPYLRHAVDSVRRQDDPDWEIVVSDNASEEDVEGFVAELQDPRVRYVRTERFVPVTDNWNNALHHSRGDWIVMLGDDDALLPGYITTLRDTVARCRDPQAVYVGAYHFAYPGVLPDAPEGYLRLALTAPFFAHSREPFVVDPDQAHGLARAAAGLRNLYDFNMQHAAVARTTVEELAAGGDFFRSPFPDYYAMNHIFAVGERIGVDPNPRVVVGITPRSHGFLHYNRREADARAMLASDAVEPEILAELESVLMPGTNMNTSWLVAMQTLYRRLGSPPEMRPDYARYRRLQLIFCEQAHHVHRAIDREQLAEAEATLPAPQRLAVEALGPVAGWILRRFPDLRPRLGAAFDALVGRRVTVARSAPEETGRFATMADVLDRFERLPALPSSA